MEWFSDMIRMIYYSKPMKKYQSSSLCSLVYNYEFYQIDYLYLPDHNDFYYVWHRNMFTDKKLAIHKRIWNVIENNKK